MSTTEEPTVAVPVAEEPKKTEEAVANGDAGGAAESAAKKKRNRRKKKKAAAGGGANARTYLLLLAHVLKIGLFSSLFCLHLRFTRHFISPPLCTAGEEEEEGLESGEFAGQYGSERKMVTMFSGCRDDQTSADARIEGEPTGAMTWAFLEMMKSDQSPSYAEVSIKHNVFDRSWFD